jgi:hypothetical protein
MRARQYFVCLDRLEAENVLIKRARLVEIERRQPDVGKSAMAHGVTPGF